MKYFLSLALSLLLTILVAQTDMDTIMVNYKATGLSLAEVFSELEAEYGIRFSYATSAILEHPIDVLFEEETMDDVLDYLLSDQQMEYKIMSNNVLVRKADSYTEKQTEDYNKSIHLKGSVIQPGQNKKGLALATIAISNTSLGTYTDEQGKFDIEIPAQYMSEQLIFHALGYEDVTYTITELKDSYVMVAMQSGGFSIDEITIVNRQKPIKVDNINNTIGLNQNQLNNKSSGLIGSDLSRQLQLLPGISAHDDTSAEIKIRGSNSDETMIILDGLPIYHASHYYGIFSSVNTAFIDSINIYKNNYPLQYDGKTGGIVELYSSDRQAEKAEGNVEVNLLTASADTTIPLSKSTMISIAGRTTIGNVSNSQFNTFAPASTVPESVTNFKDPRMNQSTDPQFKFYDLNTKLQTRLRGNDVLSIQFYKSNDKLSNLYNRNLEDIQKDRLELVAKEEAYWDNTAFGLAYKMRLTPSTQWNTKIHYTRYDNEMTNVYRIEEIPQSMQVPPLMNTVSELRSKQTNSLTDTGVDSYLLHTIGSHRFQLGLSTTQHDLQYTIKENTKDRLDGGKLFYESAIYVGYTGQLTDNLSLNTGLRASYFDLNRGSYISPRALLSYELNDRISAKVSYGYYQQVIRQFHYEYRGEPMALWVSAGENGIPVLKSHNMMMGGTARCIGLTLDVEVYQKQMNGMIEYAVLDPGNGSADVNESRDYRLFRGDGVSRGIDVLISSGYKNYDTYVSYSISKSEQRFKAIARNKYFPTEDDRRHQLKWINTFNTGHITWGANTVYISGRRYTDIENLGEQGDITELQPAQRFKRLPAYQRLDLSATFDFNVSKLNSSISIALFNTLNNQNVKYVQSVSTKIVQNQIPINTVIGSDSNLLGRTLNLSWRIGF